MYSPGELVAKRLLDLTVAVAGLAAASPFLAVTALLVKASSPGPVFFKQQRVGRYGKVFTLLKFRTMMAAEGPRITVRGDRRVTRIGRILRKTKLDELPGLLNVVLGDLSLVGPRPEVPEYVALYPEHDRELLQRYRPGITDPATVKFRNEEELLARGPDPQRLYVEEVLPQKLRLCREYLQVASFLSDLKVLAETAAVIVAPTLSSPDRRPDRR